MLDEQIPDVPAVTDLEMAFPTRYRELLPTWDDLTDDEKAMRCPICDAVASLFYRGGTLADHGFTVKEGVVESKVIRYLHATLGDFGPSHEHKIGGIAHQLKQWCHIG